MWQFPAFRSGAKGLIKMPKLTILVGAAVVCLPSVAIAQEAPSENIIVSASRAGNPVEMSHYTGSVTILTGEDLEQRQARDIADVLRDVPGVAVSGTPGQTQVRMRGSEGNHVLVLADGIEISDPFAGEFDFGTLQAEIGARVEVLRGAQSALYGSDAIGGVIAYRSAAGCDVPGLSAFVEGGSNATFDAGARAAFCGDKAQGSINATFVSTDGTPNARGGTREIGRDGLTLSGQGSTELAPGFELRASGRYVATKGDYNDQDFNPTSPTLGLVIDSPGLHYENEAIYALVGARAELLDGRWTHDLSAQIADVRRDSFVGDSRLYGSKGQRLKGSYVTSIEFGGPAFTHQLSFAADIEREKYRNTDPYGYAFTGVRTSRNIGLVGEYRANSDRFDFAAAVRRDINNRFADVTTFSVSGGAEIADGTRLRAAGGSGIKNPGYYELYGYIDGQFIGNSSLRPEKSSGWEVGIDQSLADGALRLSATWFDSTLKNEIFTDYPAPDYIATPANRATNSTRKGLELSARARFGRQVTFDASYSWLDAKEGGAREVRRPTNIASAALNWSAPDDAASATVVVRYNGSARDLAFTDPSFIPVVAELGDYTLVNLAGEVKLAPSIRLFGRIENLFDEGYEQVFSFVSQGRSAIIGIRSNF